MSDSPNKGASDAPLGSPTLTFRGGGWVIALAAFLVVLVLVWSLLGVMLGRRPIGDGTNLESYGFNLSNLTIDRTQLNGSGHPRGFLPSLDNPLHIFGRDMAIYNETNRPKYVVTTDRVAGIVVNGHAHAWPLTMLNVHEVVNDTVNGVAVVATYSPLCDCVIVFERRVEGTDRLFEVSGLLCDSNLVFYDKAANAAATATHAPSLFLQLERRAISGPLATSSTQLVALPNVCITTWADWLATHPDTTVSDRDAGMIRRMKEITYARYLIQPQLESPTTPLPSEEELARDGVRLKSPMLALWLGGKWSLLAVEDYLSAINSDRSVIVRVEGTELKLEIPNAPAVARISRVDGLPLLSVPCLYFAAKAILEPREPCVRVSNTP
jgi:hypothetical protein